MRAMLFCRRRPIGPRRAIPAVLAFLAVSAFALAPPIRPAAAQAGAQSGTPVFTIIVTRHGVRAISPPASHNWSAYAWADWGDVAADDLTRHGYRLMRLMGEFYRQAQADKKLPVDCLARTAFVYADTAQRTLATAHALIEGLCGAPDALVVFHAKGTDDAKGTKEPKGAGAKDPIFDATERLAQSRRIDGFASRAAVAAAAGSPSSSLVMRHKDEFSAFQGLLDTRCRSGGCEPVVSAASAIEGGMTLFPLDQDKGGGPLAKLSGPIETASSYAEDVFLEFAQCRPEGDITRLDRQRFRTALEAGMRLHVLAYDVNARNAYDPLVRGGTLIAHVAALLGQKAGRPILGRIATPDLAGKTLFIFSGHDTQLGALGGILNAHWNPGGGIVRDDMPPGSALVFDLMRDADGHYGVRLGFASMTMDQYRTDAPLAGAIRLSPVEYTGCPGGGCVMPLAQFESLALTLEAQGLVDDGWDTSPSRLPQDPGSAAKLKDPPWTEPQCRGP
jgi:4-phytase / acid phosphatase